MPRLPEIFEREQLPADKREVYDYLIKSRGNISNGYAPLLHCPDFVGRVAHLGTYIRFESSLPAKTLELLAFATSAEMDNRYEQGIHAQAAAKLGVSQTTIDAVNTKSDTLAADEQEALPVRCARELIRTHKLSDASFALAQRAFGDKGAVEVVGTVGYYTMLALAHNAMQVRLPNT